MGQGAPCVTPTGQAVSFARRRRARRALRDLARRQLRLQARISSLHLLARLPLGRMRARLAARAAALSSPLLSGGAACLPEGGAATQRRAYAACARAMA